MLDNLRQHWEQFKASQPGERFRRVHERRAQRHPKGATWVRWAFLALGFLLVLAGIFFLAFPGPGLLVLALGLALIAQESLSVARMLDWLELKLRPPYLWAKRRWKKAGPAARWTALACLAAAGFAALVLGYRILGS